ncbi:MAG: ABC transporter permease [Candidatus Bipolaricaulia bacterium]
MFLSHWLNSYRLMLQWQALRLKPILPFIMVVQLLIAVGTVIGLGFLLPEIDPRSAMFLATGAPTLALITVGLVMVPQMVAQAKLQGTFDYMWSLPVPRMVYLAADVTIWLSAALPGVVLALIVGSLRYGFDLQISPLVVPAFLLVALTATAIGYTIAHLSPSPVLTTLITNVIVGLFMFSPVNYPAERLPVWFAELHRFLPLKYVADVIRGTLTQGDSGELGLAFTVLGAWCVVGFGITYAMVTRQR